MWMSSGMTLAGALASGCAMQAAPGLTNSPALLSASLPSARVFHKNAVVEVTREIDGALRNALARSTTLVTLL